MMFVTDTHPLIHHVTGRKRRLGRRARTTFERVKRGADEVLIPFTVLEEIMLLSEAGKVRLPLPFRDLVISFAQADNFELGAMTNRFSSSIGKRSRGPVSEQKT
jgi:predicted nucleic acid-binding protein